MARQKTEHHKTAEGILISAQKHFLEKGFSGTSISDIANEAQINKSLIYHHYGNKEGLWKAVKKRILEQDTKKSIEELEFDTSSLETFIDDFANFRFNLYANHPELVRLMGWQRLEPQGDDLAGVTYLATEIKELQKKGEMRKDIPPEVINYLIFSLSSNCFMDNARFLQSKKGQKDYLMLIKEILINALRS